MANVDLTDWTQVTNYMGEATSRKDWDNRCNEVQAANGGHYPQWWREAILDSGLFMQVSSRWK